jgi:hypothetical protein
MTDPASSMPAEPKPEPNLEPVQKLEPSRFGRRIRWLALGLVVLAGLVSAAWFGGSHLYGLALSEGRAGLARDGILVECADETQGGFPARFEVRCASLSLRLPDGTSLRGGAFVSVAPAWNPLFTIGEWTGPFESLTVDGFATRVDSPLARASLRLTTSMALSRLSLVVDPFSVTLQGAPQAIASAQGAEFHVRQPEDQARLQAGALEVAQVLLGLSSPFLTGVDQIDLSISGIAGSLANLRGNTPTTLFADWLNRSGTVSPMAVRLRLDDMAIDLDGEGRIAPDRLIDFTGTIATNDVPGLVELAGIDERNGASAIIAGASFFGQQVQIGQGDAISLPVSIARGRISIGPVPVGQLDPLPF